MASEARPRWPSRSCAGRSCHRSRSNEGRLHHRLRRSRPPLTATVIPPPAPPTPTTPNPPLPTATPLIDLDTRCVSSAQADAAPSGDAVEKATGEHSIGRHRWTPPAHPLMPTSHHDHRAHPTTAPRQRTTGTRSSSTTSPFATFTTTTTITNINHRRRRRREGPGLEHVEPGR